MEASRSHPVVVLSAGPGWGKTTLLTEWAAKSKRPFAWVWVDENDNDPIVLLTYVAVALDRVSVLEPGVFEALLSPGVSVEGTVLPRLGAALAGIDRAIVLVLDDLQSLENPAALDAVTALARHMPEGSQLALSVRDDSGIPVAALRTRGLALEIGPDDLRMDEEEASELLNAAGLALSEEEVAELTAHTEGWCAGLYLAALSIRARGARATSAATFSGSDRLVTDYLRSELLEHLSAGEIRFLTQTAVLDRMCASLCDAVLDGSGSGEILETLERSNLFVVPLDPHGEWYRYHHLFQELLRAELERADPDLVPTLLTRAVAWCEANAEPETAVRYAQEAGDVDRVARLVARCAQPAYQTGRVATTHQWFDWLERHGALERNAAVAVLGALVSAVQGAPARADRWADIAARASFDGELYDGSSSIASWKALLSALLCRQGLAEMREAAQFAVDTLGRGSQFRPTALLLLAVSELLSGDTDRADDLLADAAEEGVELGAPEPAAVAQGERAAIAIKRGTWVQAEELANHAVSLIRRSRLEEYPPSAFSYAVAARVALHHGQTQRANELLVRAQRLRPRLTYALPYFSVQTRLELAHAYLTLADAAGAETMLREIEGLFRRERELGTLPLEVDELRASLKSLRANAPGASTLTSAELHTLPYLATHLSFREISERLHLSRHTVKSHAMAIYRKLSVTSRNGAVERARAIGLL